MTDILVSGDVLKVINLEDYLRGEFIGCHQNFNVVHINAESIPAHFRDFELTFNAKERYIHAILVSETFLKPQMDEIYNLHGYKLIRNDRELRKRGGVAIYLRDDIPYEIVEKSKSTKQSGEIIHEYIFIAVNLPIKTLLGVYYRPPSTSTDLSSLKALLQRLRPEYKAAIIMGDFNICQLLKNNFPHVLHKVGLKILQSSATHRKPYKTPSLIDLKIVSNEENVSKHGQLSACFSYHDLIYVSYKIQGESNSPIFQLGPSSYTDNDNNRPSSKEQKHRSERLSYKRDYDETRNIHSLIKYQDNKEWQKYEQLYGRKRKSEYRSKSFRPWKKNRVQQFLPEYDNKRECAEPEHRANHLENLNISSTQETEPS